MSTGSSPRSRVWRGLPSAPTPLEVHAWARRPKAAPDPEPNPQPAVREAWQRGFEEGVRDGHEQGLRSGYEEGLLRGEAEAAKRNEDAMADALDRVGAQRGRLAALAAAVEGAVQAAVEAAEEEMVGVCYEAVCRIVAAEAVSPDTVVAHLRRRVAERRVGTVVAVHVHPEDLLLLQPSNTASAFDSPGPEWIGDPEVALGGCLLQLSAGALDLRLETALEACKAVLLRTRAERASSTGEAP